MTERYAFASDAWLQVLQQQAQKLLDAADAAPDAAFTYSEAFTDVPVPRTDGRKLGYILRIGGGKATVQSGVQGDEAADCSVVMGFAAACASTRVKAGPALDAIGRQAFADGVLQMSGSLAGMPISMNALHDELHARTLDVNEVARA